MIPVEPVGPVILVGLVTLITTFRCCPVIEPVTLITTFRCCPVIEQFIGGDRGGKVIKVIKVELFKTGYITLCYC